MAHFAKIDNNNVVEQVIVVHNDDIKNLEFPESEKVGQDFIKSIGLAGNWLQTSYNRKFRGNFAGVGYVYSLEKDVFISSSPYPSWIYDESVHGYKPPIAPPIIDNTMYTWDETVRNWIKI